jgi:hypothetical protein
MMKRLFGILALMIFFVSACAPAGMAPSQQAPTTITNTQATHSPKVTFTTSNQQAATQKPKNKKPKSVAGDQNPTASPDQGKGKEKNPIPAPTSANPDFIADVITGRPTVSSVTVNIVPAVAMEVYYEYGTTPGSYSAQTNPQLAAAGVPLETLIDGLQPNTRYNFRLHYGEKTGPEHTFVTQRAPGSSFVFDIQGDSHPEREGQQFDSNLYTRTLQGAAADQPDFFMTIGDDFSVDTLKAVNAETVRALYIHQRQWLGLVGRPVFLINGNHEQASMANLNDPSNGLANNVAVWTQTARNTYYPQPAPDAFYTGNTQPVEPIGLLRDYYAFTWGDALFVVIDPYWHSPQTVDNQFGADRNDKKNRDLWDVTLGDAQYQWFKHTLETSTAKYKFVFTHHVLGTGRGGVELAHTYEWGDSAHLAAHRPGWEKTIQQVMAENHVTIFFQGHDHIFVCQELDGVIYQTLPEPANPFYTYENVEAYKSVEKLPNSGRVRVSVSPDGVKVDYIRSYLDKPDELAYSYTTR